MLQIGLCKGQVFEDSPLKLNYSPVFSFDQMSQLSMFDIMTMLV